MKIDGLSAVVTGAGHGIGRALALALAGRGVRVAVADIDGEAAERVADEARRAGAEAFGRSVDVSDAGQVEALADAAHGAFGDVRLLFNNAGVMTSASLIDAPERDADWILGVNIKGVANGVRVFGRRFADQGEPAWIVNTGSEHSVGVPHLGAGLYTASKHAVLGLSDVLRRELPEHVGVSVLLPGLVRTTLWRAVERRPGTYGGPERPDSAAEPIMDRGMPAEEVAERCLLGVESEQFYIPTHPHVIEYARERWDGLSEAFAAQSPRYPGDDAYAVGRILRELGGDDG